MEEDYSVFVSTYFHWLTIFGIILNNFNNFSLADIPALAPEYHQQIEMMSPKYPLSFPVASGANTNTLFLFQFLPKVVFSLPQYYYLSFDQYLGQDFETVYDLVTSKVTNGSETFPENSTNFQNLDVYMAYDFDTVSAKVQSHIYATSGQFSALTDSSYQTNILLLLLLVLSFFIIFILIFCYICSCYGQNYLYQCFHLNTLEWREKTHTHWNL